MFKTTSKSHLELELMLLAGDVGTDPKIDEIDSLRMGGSLQGNKKMMSYTLTCDLAHSSSKVTRDDKVKLTEVAQKPVRRCGHNNIAKFKLSLSPAEQTHEYTDDN